MDNKFIKIYMTETQTFKPLKLSFIVSTISLAQDLLLYPLDTLGTRIRSYKHKDVYML